MQNTMLDSTVSSNSQELFDFNAKHNGEACIESLRPEDRGTERQFWFTIAMLCVIFECSADTIRRRVGTLVNTGDIDETQNCVSLTNVQAFGYNTTTLYNLNVLIVWSSFLSMLFAFGLIIGSSTIINRKRKGGWTSHPIRQWSSRMGLE